jgi:hypothetical protein
MPFRANPTRLTAMRLLVCAALCVTAAHAQTPTMPSQRPIDLGFTSVQERSKFVGYSPSDDFTLRGATVDAGVGLWRGLGIAFAGNGLAATNLRNSIDIHQISLMAGPRYTYNFGHITPTAWNRHFGVFVDGKAGYTFATSGLYPTGPTGLASSAAALAYSGGGGINVTVYHRFDIRVAQVDYVQTHLPNGGTNQQNNLRFSAGINFHLGY